jgi:hypothetical protein
MQIYECFQLSSAEKGFMSMAQQIVQQLENHIKAQKNCDEKKKDRTESNFLLVHSKKVI